MEPPHSSRSSLRPFTTPSLSPQPTLASDLLGSTSPASSSQSPPSHTPPKRRFSLFSKRSALRKCDPVTVTPKPSNSTPSKPKPKPTQVSTPRPRPRRAYTDPQPRTVLVYSRSSTILPITIPTRRPVPVRRLVPVHRPVPVSEDVLCSLKNAASGPETLLRPARDGSVSAGNLEGLLNRAIVGSPDPSRDERFKACFLTIYQLFASSEQVFEILKRRFEATYVDPSMAGSRFL